MRRQDFTFDLPEDLIAQTPPERRGDSRLLVMNRRTGAVRDHQFSELPQLLNSTDLMVFNNTRVMRARLHARKRDSGGRVEILVERVLDDTDALAQLRASKPVREGQALEVGEYEVVAGGRVGEFTRLRCAAGWQTLMDAHGHMPLPPYIARPDTEEDEARYQTVFARQPGAVAAPTAGLHFDQTMMDALDAQGIWRTEITLHVGAGTFKPVRVDRVAEHRMHPERYEISSRAADAINAARHWGNRVIAVGTTCVRTLEAAWDGEDVPAGAGETDIFLYPGKTFNVVDGLLTNFHLPESTLLMLVCAFAGTEHTLAAYRHAVEQRYRFFSYGDAMLIL